MRSWIDAEVLRLTSLRAQQLRKAGTPGPEGSIGKLAMAELTHQIFSLCVDIIGSEGMLSSDYTMTRPEIMGAVALGSNDDFDVHKAFLASVGTRIGGGTGQVMRNILGERVLGLPPEPDTSRAMPWNEVPRSGG